MVPLRRRMLWGGGGRGGRCCVLERRAPAGTAVTCMHAECIQATPVPRPMRVTWTPGWHPHRLGAQKQLGVRGALTRNQACGSEGPRWGVQREDMRLSWTGQGGLQWHRRGRWGISGGGVMVDGRGREGGRTTAVAERCRKLRSMSRSESEMLAVAVAAGPAEVSSSAASRCCRHSSTTEKARSASWQHRCRWRWTWLPARAGAAAAPPPRLASGGVGGPATDAASVAARLPLSAPASGRNCPYRAEMRSRMRAMSK